MHVLIVAAYGKDGKISVMNPAWGMIYDIDKFVIRSSNQIARRMGLGVNVRRTEDDVVEWRGRPALGTIQKNLRLS